ncbi:MAG: DNA translocase FtsK 4TM domain-containing protein [Alphaproteobacteria bacterium]|nr:DNA translocase FtsK 4TM domain-containing protein [Alphaproteobacteria bacterium]
MVAKTQEKAAFLPAGTTDYLRKRGIECLGVGLIVLGLALLAALISYDPLDPSPNTATDRIATNLLGMTGAAISDVALQSLGMAAFLGFPLLAGWGWRLVVDRSLPRAWVRLALTPVLAILTAAALATLPAHDSWPIASGLGGFLGDMSLGALTAVLPPVEPGWIGLVLAVPAAAIALYGFGITLGEWRALGVQGWTGLRGAASLARKSDQLAPALKDLLTRDTGRVEPTLDRSVKRETPQRVTPAAPRPQREDRVETPEATRPSKRAKQEQQIRLDLPPQDGEFHLPPIDILVDRQPDPEAQSQNAEGLEQNARMLEGVLEDFGVKGEIVRVRPGPVVTLYELEPAPGTKTSRVIGLSDDIARSMSAISVRIATVPGRSVIGIELPNGRREMVGFRELVASDTYDRSKSKLPLILGKDIGGAPEVVDLATMPHLLIAGTTGSGKSVGMNTMILSLLYKMTPDQCRFIMIDPKMLELSVYDDIPHLLAPVVTDPKKAVVALKWAVREMEDRYRAMSKLGVRNIEGYNKRVAEASRKGEVITRRVQTGFDAESGKPIFEDEPLDLSPLPYIVVLVDEMADLMLVAGKDIEASIQRLAQMARAAGIHLIMATQRPSVDVITGTIKANFPTRISFQVTSKVDSRTILGEQGAEQLLGKGDMLHMAGGGRVTRVHGPFVDDSEVEAVCQYLKSMGTPAYVDSVTDEDDMTGGFDTDVSGASSPMGGGSGDDGGENSLYDQAVALVAREGKCSTSFVQRHLQIGYNRAARIVERMEKEGVVSAANHVGKRNVLIGDHSA